MISVENTACYGLWGSFSLTYWFCLFFVLRPSRVYFEDVIFAGVRLQNLHLSQAPTVLRPLNRGRGGIFIVSHMLCSKRIVFVLVFFFFAVLSTSPPQLGLLLEYWRPVLAWVPAGCLQTTDTSHTWAIPPYIVKQVPVVPAQSR